MDTNKLSTEPIPMALETTAAENSWMIINELRITVLKRWVFSYINVFWTIAYKKIRYINITEGKKAQDQVKVIKLTCIYIAIPIIKRDFFRSSLMKFNRGWMTFLYKSSKEKYTGKATAAANNVSKKLDGHMNAKG